MNAKQVADEIRGRITETESEYLKRRHIEDFMETMDCTKDEAIKFLALAQDGFEYACCKLARHRAGGDYAFN